MRIWSIHPKYLDQKGLVAAWRELLGAIQSLDPDRGYSHHPQLERFRVFNQGKFDLLESRKRLAQYGVSLYLEAIQRGYRFDFNKLVPYLGDTNIQSCDARLPLPMGQFNYEIGHLRQKLMTQDPFRLSNWIPEPHPYFYLTDGGVESWERVG